MKEEKVLLIKIDLKNLKLCSMKNNKNLQILSKITLEEIVILEIYKEPFKMNVERACLI